MNISKVLGWFDRKKKAPQTAGGPSEGVSESPTNAREQPRQGFKKATIPDTAPLQTIPQTRSAAVERKSQPDSASSPPVRPLAAPPGSRGSGKSPATAPRNTAPATPPPLSPNQGSPASRALEQLGEKSIHARATAISAFAAGESGWFELISQPGATRYVAEALGVLGHPAGLKQLSEWASTSTDARLLMASAVALGRLLDPAAVSALRSQLAGLVTTRRRQSPMDMASFWTETVANDFADTLGVLGDNAALALIIDMYRYHSTAFSPDALSEFANDCVEPLIALLDDESVNHQRILLDFLGELGDVRMVEPLIRQLGSKHDYMVESAIQGLGRVGGQQAIEALVEVFENRRSGMAWNRPANERILAALALGKLRLPQATEVLRNGLQSPDPETRRAAANALAQVKDPLAIEPLTEMLRGSESDRAVLQALARLGHKQSLEALITVFKTSTSKDEREPIAQVLGEIRDPRTVEALSAAMDDEDEAVQLAVATALGKLGERGALDKLVAIVWAEDSNYKLRPAVEALGKIGDSAAIEALVFRLRGSLVPMRRTIWGALAEIGTPAIDILLIKLKDPRPAVRAVAAEALGQVGDTRASGPLDIAAKDSIAFVQAKALDAIRTLKRRFQSAASEAAVSTAGADKDQSPLPPEAPPVTAPALMNTPIVARRVDESTDLSAGADVKRYLRDLQVEDVPAEAKGRALLAFLNIGDTSVALLLDRIRSSPDRHEQYTAAKVLGFLGYHNAVEPLLAMWVDIKDHWLLCEWSRALGCLADRRAAETLVRLVRALGVQAYRPNAFNASMESIKHDALGDALARALGVVGDDSVIPVLVPMLDDDCFGIRDAASEALVELGAAGIAALLAKARDAGTLEDLRRSPVRALEMLNDPGVAAALAEVTQDDCTPEDAKDNRDFDQLMKGVSAGTSPYARADAARALGKLGDKRAFDTIVPLLKSSEKDLRQAGAEALAGLGDPKAIPLLASAMQDREQGVRQAAAVSLASLKDARAFEPLLVNLLPSALSHVRLQAIDALGRLGDARAVESLVRCLHWAFAPERNAIYGALRCLGAPAVDRLLVELADPRPLVRSKMAEALGNLGNVSALEPLRKLLDDSDTGVKSVAAAALEKVTAGSSSSRLNPSSPSDIESTSAPAGPSLLETPMGSPPAGANGESYICDICAAGILKTSGYAYTTSQVVRSVRYWRWYFEHGRESKADPDGSSVGLDVSMLACTGTSWIVCEDCVQYIDADHKAARAYATAGNEPPGCGAVDQQVACVPAGYGWSLAHDEWPVSIQVGKNPIIHDASAGTRCDFCRRILYGDEQFGLLMADTYKKLLDEGASFVRKPRPSKCINGVDSWIACNTCLGRAGAL